MRAGDAVWNPLTGEKAMMVQSAEDSDGARIVWDFAVEPGGFVPGGEHVHDHCTEHLEVTAGQINFVLDRRERTLGAGEAITVPTGTWHQWSNPNSQEVRLRVRIEPALRFEQAVLTFWGLCAEGRTNAAGRPSPLLGALVGTLYRQEIRYRQPPDPLQRLLFPPLAALARRRGIQSTIDRYLELDIHPSAQAALGHLPEHVMGRTKTSTKERTHEDAALR